MSEIKINFNRVEKKYLLSSKEYEALMLLIGDKIVADRYGKTRIHSIYFDTPDYQIIRNSIYHEGFKEKLRLRTYGEVKESSLVFLEVKRKTNGVVYKRRIALTSEQAQKYLSQGVLPFDNQIMREIDYVYNFYKKPKAAIRIFCDREAFVLKEDENLRITFDQNIFYDFENPDLRCLGGKPLLENGQRLMEIKTTAAIPLWLSEILNKNEILPRSFSKYGKAYGKEKGEKL